MQFTFRTGKKQGIRTHCQLFCQNIEIILTKITNFNAAKGENKVKVKDKTFNVLKYLDLTCISYRIS